jgi:hypothetical protein
MSRGPGRWQAAILAELVRRTLFALAPHFTQALGRHLTAAEQSAIHRAAKVLQRRGRCRTALVNVKDHGLLTLVSRPDCVSLETISVERVPSGTGSTFIRGSLRHIAHQERISKTQVVRDLQRVARSKPR